jgi:hypothetical protein
MEGDVSSWSVVNEPGLTSGAWEQADPNGTLAGGGFVAPEDDATPDGTMAFVTENGPPGGSHSTNDVDGGSTYLLSPVLDVSGGDALVSYARWVVSVFGTNDPLVVEITDDGGASWTTVETVAATDAAWESASFLVGDYVTPTAQVQVRFGICDCPNDSSTEAGIDDFLVTAVCQCPADLDGDGAVGTADLLALLSAWGTDPGGPPDLDGDGNVGTGDLLELLSSWGPCS